jgi:hypothetical protein
VGSLAPDPSPHTGSLSEGVNPPEVTQRKALSKAALSPAISTYDAGQEDDWRNT